MLTIVVYMRKGGVGKTTLSALIAQYLAGLGYTGVILDLDRQGSQTALFGLPDDTPELMAQVLLGQRPLTDALLPLPDAMVPRFKKCKRGYLALVTGGPQTKMAMDEVVAAPRRYGLDSDADLFRAPLHALDQSGGVDFAVLDLGPSDQAVALAALLAADFILIPTDSEYLSLQGIASVLADVSVAQQYNDLNILGIVPTMTTYYFGRLRPSKTQAATWAFLTAHYPDLLLTDDAGPVDLPYDEDWRTSVWVGEMLFGPSTGKRAKNEALRFLNAVGARLGVEAVKYE